MSARGQLRQFCRLSASRIYKTFTRNEGVRSSRLTCAAFKDTEREYHTTSSVCACSGSVTDSAVKSSNSRRRRVIGSERKEQFSAKPRESQALNSKTSIKDTEDDAGGSFKKRTESGPQLSDFIRDAMNVQEDCIIPTESSIKKKATTGSVPYINPKMLHGNQRKGQNSMVTFHGCGKCWLLILLMSVSFIRYDYKVTVVCRKES